MVAVWAVLATVVVLFSFVIFRGAPYVPSRKKYIREAFRDLYPLTAGDMLVDIGSGDGVVLREAARLGATAVGFEINPILAALSWLMSVGEQRVTIKFVDYTFSHLPTGATVVYAFSTARGIGRIAKWLQAETNRVGKPVYLISYGFALSGLKESKVFRAYYLYRLDPLHTD